MRKNVESWQIGKGQDIYKDIQKHLVKQTLTLSVQTLRSPPDRNTKEEMQSKNKYLEMLDALVIKEMQIEMWDPVSPLFSYLDWECDKWMLTDFRMACEFKQFFWKETWKYYQKPRHVHTYDIVISLLGKWPWEICQNVFFLNTLPFVALLNIMKIRINLKMSKIWL